jgi:hypothetical protein
MLSYDEGHGTDCPERAAITSVSPALITLTRIERAQGPGGGKVLPHRQRVCLPIPRRTLLSRCARASEWTGAWVADLWMGGERASSVGYLGALRRDQSRPF